MRCCFLPCFGANSKRTKHLRSPNATPTATGGALTHVAEGAIEPAIQLTKQKTVEELIDCITESKEEQEKAAREAETPLIDEKKDDHEEDDEVNKRLLQEESSESLFSLSIGSKNQASEAEKAETEVNSPMKLPGTIKEESEAIGSSPSVPHRVQQVSSVLNPLENLAQGKPSKATEVESSKKEAKENTKSLVVKLEEQPNCIAIRKVNPNEESSAKGLIKKLEENREEKENHPEHRYRDCCDEGYEDINLDESDLDVTFEDNDPHNEKRREGEEGVEDVNGTYVQEESSESLFSLSIDSRKRISSAENVENEVNSVIMPAHVSEEEEESQRKIADVSSVLNPIENVTQGRVVKATMCRISLKKDKENINLVVQQDVDNDIPISPEPNLRLSSHKTRQKKFNDKKQEVGVDISLSSWLVEPETTPISMNSNSANSVGEHTPKGGRVSPLSHEDRPILGALTIEEIRKYSVSTSSRRSRSRSPDETPIIGTVGSYWSHTGQRRNSELNKNGKDAKLKSSSATLNTRLEKAFEAEA